MRFFSARERFCAARFRTGIATLFLGGGSLLLPPLLCAQAEASPDRNSTRSGGPSDPTGRGVSVVQRTNPVDERGRLEATRISPRPVSSPAEEARGSRPDHDGGPGLPSAVRDAGLDGFVVKRGNDQDRVSYRVITRRTHHKGVSRSLRKVVVIRLPPDVARSDATLARLVRNRGKGIRDQRRTAFVADSEWGRLRDSDSTRPTRSATTASSTIAGAAREATSPADSVVGFLARVFGDDDDRSERGTRNVSGRAPSGNDAVVGGVGDSTSSSTLLANASAEAGSEVREPEVTRPPSSDPASLQEPDGERLSSRASATTAPPGNSPGASRGDGRTSRTPDAGEDESSGWMSGIFGNDGADTPGTDRGREAQSTSLGDPDRGLFSSAPPEPAGPTDDSGADVVELASIGFGSSPASPSRGALSQGRGTDSVPAEEGDGDRGLFGLFSNDDSPSRRRQRDAENSSGSAGGGFAETSAPRRSNSSGDGFFSSLFGNRKAGSRTPNGSRRKSRDRLEAERRLGIGLGDRREEALRNSAPTIEELNRGEELLASLEGPSGPLPDMPEVAWDEDVYADHEELSRRREWSAPEDESVRFADSNSSSQSTSASSGGLLSPAPPLGQASEGASDEDIDALIESRGGGDSDGDDSGEVEYLEIAPELH